MTKFREILANRNFLFLWLGQVVSNFGDRLNQMALVALVYQSQRGSEMALAKIISFTVIPVFVIGPIAGAWVDRLNRKNIMVISDIMRGSLVILIPLFIIFKQMVPVYLIIFLTFSISRFFVPSKMALIPDIVARDNILMANTLQDTTQMIGSVVGLVAAGIIVNMPRVGAIGGFYIDSASFFISASLIAMIAQGEVSRRSVAEGILNSKKALEGSIRRSLFAEMRQGLGYLAQYPNMRFVMSVFFLLMAGIGAISCVIIVFVQEIFGTATRDLGFLGMYLAGGLFAGTVLYGRFGQKIPRRLAIYSSFIAAGLAVTLFALMLVWRRDIFSGALMACLVGISASPIMASTNTLTHETIPQEVRGRIFSCLEAVIHFGFLAFMFIAAYAAKHVGRFWIIAATGAVFAACGIAGLALDKKRFVTCS